MLYISCPYTHNDPFVRATRVEQCARYAGSLIEKGEIVYAPLPHLHHIEQHYGYRFNYDALMDHCLAMLSKADEMVVLMLDGWNTSKGVRLETEQAELYGIPWRRVDYNDD